MDTSREDVGIAIRSAFLQKGTQQRFSLLVLIILALLLLAAEKINLKAINYFKSAVKDFIYIGSVTASYPTEGVKSLYDSVKGHIYFYEDYNRIKDENYKLKNKISNTDFLTLENIQLKEMIEDQHEIGENFISSRVMLDKQSPYINSFIINSGSNKKIKNGLAVLDGPNFIGRIVDVNFFSSRVLLVTDLNSKIPVIVEPSGVHAILSGRGSKPITLDYLPKNISFEEGNKVYTSGKGGIFKPGIPIGEIIIEDNNLFAVSLFSDLSQTTFVNINTAIEEVFE